MATDYEAVRALVWSRAKGYCERCGKSLSDNWALHHRKLRSRGGLDTADNLVALHHECHNLATNSVHNQPKLASEQGFMVSSWAEPSEVPLLLPNGDSVTLNKDGTYSVLERKATNERTANNSSGKSWF